jgi:multiple sugar transport system substrate-binding protein
MQLTMDARGRNAMDPNFDPNIVKQWGFHWQWDSTRSMAVIFGAGDVVDVNGDAVIPPQWREGFNWYYEGIWKKHFIPSLVLANGPMMKGNPFYSGKVAMINYFTSYTSRLVGVPGLISIPEWDIAAVPSYNGKVTTRLERDGILILNNTQHPAEAVEIAYSIATNPELLLAWEMLPAFNDLQSLFLKQLAAKHPGVDWQVMLDSMDYADTTYDKVMPNYRKSYDRLLAFRDLLGNEENLTLEFEIDKLESDLQELYEEVR